MHYTPSVLKSIDMSLLRYFHRAGTPGPSTSTCDDETENVRLEEPIDDSGENPFALEYITYDQHSYYTTIQNIKLIHKAQIHTTLSTDLYASQSNSPITNSDSLSRPVSPEQPARSDNSTTPASKRPALGPSGHCDDVAQFINTHSNSTSAERYNPAH